MGSLSHAVCLPNPWSHPSSTIPVTPAQPLSSNFKIAMPPRVPRRRHLLLLRLAPADQGASEEEAAEDFLVEELRVPDAWLLPSNAAQESEWLRVVLHKWLDDEYCPEATNIEISKVAASSYYESLMAKRTDLGEILLKMASDLETISFQESFHGAFSSANAAILLITQRVDSTQTP